MENDSNDRITLVGLVVPAQWDKNGEIVGIAISGYDEKDYPVLMDKVGRRLMAFMHEEVSIMGKTIEIENREVMKIKRFNKNSI
ncbi:hypothetical protein ACFL1Z_04510 [Thermodesulfobacteriota bacterium]